MGLLDAEGYKFLEGSESNSDSDQVEEEAHLAQEAIYEMRPLKAGKPRKVAPQALKIEQLNFEGI